jgi:hypothetical protein
MRRDKILAVLLAISLCANVYLIFFGYSAQNHPIEGLAVPALFPSSGIINDSGMGYGNSNFQNPDEIFPENVSLGLNKTLPDESGVANDLQPVTTPEETGKITPAPIQEIPVTASTQPTPTPEEWINYSNSRNKFSLRYPASWNISETSTGSSRGVLLLTAPIEKECPQGDSQCYQYSAKMTIEIDQNPETPNPEEYFVMAVAGLQDKYSITSTSKSASCILSGSRAYQIEFFTRDERGHPERSYMQYYGIFDGKAFIISYFGPYSTGENVYSRNKGNAQRIIDSVEVERTYLEV